MYTSGTTGLPKGVVHSHATVFWAILTFEASCDLRDGDRYLVALPLFHVGALTPVALNVYRGVTSIVMREFDPVRAWSLIEEEAVAQRYWFLQCSISWSKCHRIKSMRINCDGYSLALRRFR